MGHSGDRTQDLLTRSRTLYRLSYHVHMNKIEEDSFSLKRIYKNMKTSCNCLKLDSCHENSNCYYLLWLSTRVAINNKSVRSSSYCTFLLIFCCVLSVNTYSLSSLNKSSSPAFFTPCTSFPAHNYTFIRLNLVIKFLMAYTCRVEL